MLFDREGGGNLVFNASPTSNTDAFQVTITRKAYRDTNVQVTIIRDSITAGVIDSLVKALNGQIQLEGSFKQSTALTGTWAFIYMVQGNNKTEVTNITLRNTLLKLEPIVLLKYSDPLFPIPGWVNQLIAEFQSEPVGNPPQSIWSYEYNGQTVYYIPPQCCDQFSILYDSTGYIICAPDGGFTGRGDGQCPDFFQERKNECLIWQDSRQR